MRKGRAAACAQRWSGSRRKAGGPERQGCAACACLPLPHGFPCSTSPGLRACRASTAWPLWA